MLMGWFSDSIGNCSTGDVDAASGTCNPNWTHTGVEASARDHANSGIKAEFSSDAPDLLRSTYDSYHDYFSGNGNGS